MVSVPERLLLWQLWRFDPATRPVQYQELGGAVQARNLGRDAPVLGQPLSEDPRNP